jgi:hypothetical protein
MRVDYVCEYCNKRYVTPQEALMCEYQCLETILKQLQDNGAIIDFRIVMPGFTINEVSQSI